MASHSYLTTWAISFAIFASVLASFCASASAEAPSRSPAAPTKAQFLSQLKTIQGRQSAELQELDDAVKKRLGESTSLNLKLDTNLADRRISKLGGQLDDLAKRRVEYTARRDFLSNLIFAVDTKWAGQPINQFLEHTFLDMAMTDITDSKIEGRLYKFLIYASIAIREVPEKNEDVVAVLESFMNFANVIDPKTPALFLANRSYTSGSLSYSAKPVARDRVGDLVDKRIQELAIEDERAGRTQNKAPADIELRLKPIAAPPVNDETGTVVSGATSPAVEAPPAPRRSPSPSEKKKLPNSLPAVNPINGAAIPPQPPAVPGQK